MIEGVFTRCLRNLSAYLALRLLILAWLNIFGDDGHADPYTGDMVNGYRLNTIVPHNLLAIYIQQEYNNNNILDEEQANRTEIV